jgi:hypothetical protein
MRKIKCIAILVISMVFITSCAKDEMDINLTQKVDGNLKLILTTSSGSPIVNQKVELMNYESTLEEAKTDANGVAVFNNILMGSYNIAMKDVLDGDLEYTFNQPVQVINDVTKEYQITPSDFAGSISITVYDSWNDENIAGINVVIFKSDDFINNEFQSILDMALFTGITDANGIVEFQNLPFAYYGIMVYTDANPENYKWEYQYFNIYYKGQERKTSFNYYQN